jgi:hypothetical protein
MAALELLLDATRVGHGRTLVVEGEAGIGKTALLRFASDHASGFQLLRAEGAEFEMELAFAALYQLCLPVLRRLEHLPGPHRDALTAAFGLRAAPAPEPFMVGAGLTSLLSDVANEGPLLCVLDDAQCSIRPPRGPSRSRPGESTGSGSRCCSPGATPDPATRCKVFRAWASTD